MAILMTVNGMPVEAYQGMFSAVGSRLPQSDGFIAHFAEETPDGVTVREVWESRRQFEKFFADNIAPNMPPGGPAPHYTQLLNAAGR